MFENPEIPLDQLPTVDDVDWQKLDPSFVTQLRLQFGLFLLIPIAAVTFMVLQAEAQMPYVLIPYAIILAFAVIGFLWPAIAVRRRGYVLRDKDMLFKKGVIWRSVTAVPFNRIQHVETSNTPLDRRFGLASLKLFTAGGWGGDLKVDGLEAETAEQLRVFVLEKTGADLEAS